MNNSLSIRRAAKKSRIQSAKVIAPKSPVRRSVKSAGQTKTGPKTPRSRSKKSLVSQRTVGPGRDLEQKDLRSHVDHLQMLHLSMAGNGVIGFLFGLNIAALTDVLALVFLSTNLCLARWTVLPPLGRTWMTCAVTLNIAQVGLWLHFLRR